MARSAFLSFHYERDHWRVQQVINMGVIEGQQILSSQSWEAVKRQGRQAIENLDRQPDEVQGRSCRSRGRSDCESPLGGLRD